jgi:hypothetical protein
MPIQSDPENLEKAKVHELLMPYLSELFIIPIIVLCFEELKPLVQNIVGSVAYATLAKLKASILD